LSVRLYTRVFRPSQLVRARHGHARAGAGAEPRKFAFLFDELDTPEVAYYRQRVRGGQTIPPCPALCTCAGTGTSAQRMRGGSHSLACSQNLRSSQSLMKQSLRQRQRKQVKRKRQWWLHRSRRKF
jgi:hypothetical protein